MAGDANLYRYCGNGPTDGTDPNGLLVVHIWNYTGTKSAWGHASITLDDGTYISWWPRPDHRVAGDLPDVFTTPAYQDEDSTLLLDEEREGTVSKPKPPDVEINIHGLCEKNIKKWWDKFRATNQWNTRTQNCSTTAADALKAGNADSYINDLDVFTNHHQVWSPADVETYAKAIAAKIAEIEYQTQQDQAGQGAMDYFGGGQ